MARTSIGARASSLLLAAAIAVPVAAAPPDTTTYQFPEIEVQALRGRDRLREIPAASFVISRHRIQTSGASRISSLLQRLPGLYGYQQNSNGDPSVVDPRGFTANGESSYLKLLVNGQDVRDVENGNVDWDWILPRDVERLEVVEGPGAWVYGDGAEGGIVNVVRAGDPPGLGLNYGVQAGSFGYASGGGTASFQSEDRSGDLRGSFKRVTGWRERANERVLGGGVNGAWLPTDRHRVTLNISALDALRSDPGALRPDQIAEDRGQPDTRSDFNHARRLLVGGGITEGRVEESEWSVSPYLRYEDVDQVKTLLYQTKYHPTKALTAGTEMGWKLSTHVGGRPLLLSAAGQIEQAKLTSKHFAYSDFTIGGLETHTESFRATFSGFVGAQVTLGARTSARVGFRQDAIRVRSDDLGLGTTVPRHTFWLSSPFLGITHQLLPRAQVYGSVSTAFRAPTLSQLFDRRPFFNPFTSDNVYLSNPGLAPQKSRGAEVGTRLDGPRGGHVQVTAYGIWVRDEIDFDAATVSYANISRSLHHGLQGALEQPLFARLGAFASATYAPTTIRGGVNDGHQINAVPRRMAYGSLRWEGSSFWTLEAGLRYVGPQFLDKENEHRLPGYRTVDAGASVRVLGLTAALRMLNLLDVEYSDTGYLVDLGPGFVEERLYPSPGRSLMFSLSAN